MGEIGENLASRWTFTCGARHGLDGMSNSTNVLLTSVDEWDPYVPGLAGEAAGLGPTLTLLANLPVTRLVLLSTAATPGQAMALETSVQRLYPELEVEWVSVSVSSGALPERLESEVKRCAALGALTVCHNTGPEALQEAWSFVVANAPDARWISVQPLLGRGHAGPAVSSGKPRAIARVREAMAAYGLVEPRLRAPDLTTACRQLGLRGEDPSFRRVLEMAERLAPHSVPLLIHGETGTGKGMLAALIHEMSERHRAPFVAVNCAALPEALVESILFGHRKGSFTGASSDQPGKFVLADGGTLFLDEVGELPLALQAKLLRVLEDGVVEPIGAARGVPVNVRVIAATHRDLKAAVADKSFREDLYFRLGYAQLVLPPLRARRGDIKLLALHQLAQLNRSMPTPRRMDASAMKRLEEHTWPGNIRELSNVLGRSVLLSDHAVLDADDIQVEPLPTRKSSVPSLPELGAGFSLEAYLSDVRHALIAHAIEVSGGNKSQAARLLGITPQAVHKHLRKE